MNTTVFLIEKDGTKTILYNKDRLPEFYGGHESLYEHHFYIDFPREIKLGEKICYMLELDNNYRVNGYYYDKNSTRNLVLDLLTRRGTNKSVRCTISDPNTLKVWPPETRKNIGMEVTELSTGKKAYALHWEVNYPPFGGTIKFDW